MNNSTTLAEAKAELRRHVYDGARCPVCTQFAKVYKRKIHATMARELILLYRAAGTEWAHWTQSAGIRGGDLAKTRYWGLLEEQDGERDDGSKHTGMWRVTDRGQAFVLHTARVPKYALIYDGRCLGLSGEPVSISDALGDRFNYRELMAA